MKLIRKNSKRRRKQYRLPVKKRLKDANKSNRIQRKLEGQKQQNKHDTVVTSNDGWSEYPSSHDTEQWKAKYSTPK